MKKVNFGFQTLTVFVKSSVLGVLLDSRHIKSSDELKILKHHFNKPLNQFKK